MLRLNTEALQRAMQREGLSQREVARRANLHYNTLYAIIHGKQEATLTTVSRLADVLGVSPFALLVDD